MRPGPATHLKIGGQLAQAKPAYDCRLAWRNKQVSSSSCDHIPDSSSRTSSRAARQSQALRIRATPGQIPASRQWQSLRFAISRR